jgi:hypothetical protein
MKIMFSDSNVNNFCSCSNFYNLICYTYNVISQLIKVNEIVHTRII